MPFRLRLLAVAVLLALSAAACGGTSETVGTGSANEHLTDEFSTVAGETIDLASLQGEDVVLWFWAPW